MHSWRNRSLRTKLLLLTLVTSSVALLVAGCVLFAYQFASFRFSVIRDLRSAATMVGETAAGAIRFDQTADAEEILAVLRDKQHVLSAALYLPDGTLFAGYSQAGLTSDFPAAPGKDGAVFEHGRLILTQPVVVRRERIAKIRIEYDYEGDLADMLLVYSGLGALAIVLSLGLAWFISRWLASSVSRPILVLAETARRVSENQDYSVRAQGVAHHELQPFVDAFNGMLARIQAQDGDLRRANEGLEERVSARTRELSGLQRHLELILNSAGEGIYGMDMKRQITFANSAAARFLGWERGSWIHGDEHALCRHATSDGKPFPKSACAICVAYDAGEPVHLRHVRFGRGDGRTFPVDLMANPIFEEGRRVGTVVVFQDVTLEQSLEIQLRQAQRLESIGRLAAGVAHDFNNILMVIHGHATMLSRKILTCEEVEDSIREIQQASERAGDVTKQLLAFSRKQVLRRRPLDPNSLLLNVTRLLTRLLGEDIELELDLGSGLSNVEADSAMIEQVIMNLAVNARDAMPAGGRVVLGTSELVVSAGAPGMHPDARPGRYVVLRVTDTGLGMDESTMTRIFEPFFTTKEAGKGTGLGLAMAYGIVRQHEGWLDVQSKLGAGSTFSIHLPVSTKTTAAAPRDPATRACLRGEGETILLVEDELPLLRLARRFLVNLGYEVLEARSGAEALRLWSAYPGRIDLLFTDVVMPDGVSGGELGRQLTALRPGLKVLYCSGYSVEFAGRNLALLPGENFLPKPYTEEILAEAVHRSLHGAPEIPATGLNPEC